MYSESNSATASATCYYKIFYFLSGREDACYEASCLNFPKVKDQTH